VGVFFLFFCPYSIVLEWSLPSPFIDARGAQGYKRVLRDVFSRRKDLNSGLCLVVGGTLLLEEWPLSLDAVAMCFDIHSPTATKCRIVIITVATSPSLWFDYHREPRTRWHESWCDFTPFEGIVA
jgi:hypothetical protein